MLPFYKDWTDLNDLGIEMDFAVFDPIPKLYLLPFYKDWADLKDLGIEINFVVFDPIPNPFP